VIYQNINTGVTITTTPLFPPPLPGAFLLTTAQGPIFSPLNIKTRDYATRHRCLMLVRNDPPTSSSPCLPISFCLGTQFFLTIACSGPPFSVFPLSPSVIHPSNKDCHEFHTSCRSARLSFPPPRLTLDEALIAPTLRPSCDPPKPPLYFPPSYNLKPFFPGGSSSSLPPNDRFYLVRLPATACCWDRHPKPVKPTGLTPTPIFLS